MNETFDRAETIADVMGVFDPRQPLFGGSLDAYYVARAGSPVARLAALLKDTGDGFTKIVFAGHRGSGKSTELARLTSLLAEDFFVADTTVEGNLDLASIDYVQVLFTLVRAIYETARASKVELSESLATHRSSSPIVCSESSMLCWARLMPIFANGGWLEGASI